MNAIALLAADPWTAIAALGVLLSALAVAVGLLAAFVSGLRRRVDELSDVVDELDRYSLRHRLPSQYRSKQPRRWTRGPI